MAATQRKSEGVANFRQQLVRAEVAFDADVVEGASRGSQAVAGLHLPEVHVSIADIERQILRQLDAGSERKLPRKAVFPVAIDPPDRGAILLYAESVDLVSSEPDAPPT